jgi:hypothetical protein
VRGNARGPGADDDRGNRWVAFPAVLAEDCSGKLGGR